MYRRKQYGQSKIEKCPFCGKQATVQNSQGVPVCLAHKKTELNNLKCLCGEWLDMKAGKWGPYFHCMNCGNVNFRKGLEMNPDFNKEEVKAKEKEEPKPKKNAKKYNPKPTNEKDKNTKKEVVVTSDELDFLY